MDQNTNPGARFAPPNARIDDPSQPPGELVLADRGMRFVAGLIDGLIAFAILWLLSTLTSWNPFASAGEFVPLLINQSIGFGVFVLLQGWLLLKHGQTIGKWLLRVRIVRPDGRRADAMRLLGLRYGSGFVLMALPILGPLYAVIDSLAIFGKQRRCLHDLIADTIVVRL